MTPRAVIEKAFCRGEFVMKSHICADIAVGALQDAGLTICDLKPLAELLGCEPEMGAIKDATHSLVSANRPAPRIFAAIARALNWERTGFSTLAELLAEIRGEVEQHSKFVDAAIEQNELMDAARGKLCKLAATLGSVPLLNEAIALLEPRKCGDKPVEAQTLRQNDELTEVTKDMLDKIIQRGRAPSPAEPGMFTMLYARALEDADTHTILHASELYRDATLLLQTPQLIAWRTDDGQEFSAAAHSVTLDPDADGVAAEILSRITGYELAPEHIAELRAQMGGVI